MKPLAASLFALAVAAAIQAGDPEHPLQTWVKRHPLPGKKGKPSPRLGYEAAYAYDPVSKLLIRYGGHNQGGGGEQHSEVWTYDLERDVWTLMEPNTSPPGVCCDQQNVYHAALGKYVRFPSFSASHGWQSIREVRLRDSSVWTYDLPGNRWLDMRPIPEPAVRPLRGAAYDPLHEVIVLHGGETASHGTLVYDLYTNTWHQRKPKPAPQENLSQPGFAFEPLSRRFVLFGSQFAADPRTWLYNLEKNAWEVLEVDERPPFDKSCPVLEGDSRNGIVLGSIRNGKDLETWALDVATKSWKKLDVKWLPDDRSETTAGTRNRLLVYLPDRNLFVQEIRTNKEQQLWTFRHAEAKALAVAPNDVRLNVAADAATLSWKHPAKDATFSVYRGTGDVAWEVDWRLAAKGLKTPSFVDRAVKPGETTWYRVHTESEPGSPLPRAHGPLARTQPPVVRDLVVSATGNNKVELNWQAPAGDNIAGYHVERADVMVYSTDEVKAIRDRLEGTSQLAVGQIRRVGPFRRITARPTAALQHVDETADFEAGPVKEIKAPLWQRDLKDDQLVADGKPYRHAVFAYRVIAVNRLGVESGPSPVRFSFPSSVENVFAREEGKAATSLKWEANRERGICGYLVYRHDGRFSKSKIAKLTAMPIAERSFRDEDSGTMTRRYEIVAVDALGQEGMPSYPVWSRREWQSFYVPYTSEWHQ